MKRAGYIIALLMSVFLFSCSGSAENAPRLTDSTNKDIKEQPVKTVDRKDVEPADKSVAKDDTPVAKDAKAAGDAYRGKIEAKVIEIVSKIMSADKAKVESNTSLAGDLGMDELDVVELIIELEDAFKVVISDEDAIAVKTVRDAVDCLVKMKVKAP